MCLDMLPVCLMPVTSLFPNNNSCVASKPEHMEMSFFLLFLGKRPISSSMSHEFRYINIIVDIGKRYQPVLIRVIGITTMQDDPSIQVLLSGFRELCSFSKATIRLGFMPLLVTIRVPSRRE